MAPLAFHAPIIDAPQTQHIDVAIDSEWNPEHRDRREDLSVQVKLAPHGLWHKKAIGGAKTACGEVIPENYSMRQETYAGAMCPTCFTPYERKQAAIAVQQAKLENAPSEPHIPRIPKKK